MKPHCNTPTYASMGMSLLRVTAGKCLTAAARPPPPRVTFRLVVVMGPWTVTHSSLRMLRRVAAFCRPLRPVLLLVSFLRSRSPVVGVLGLC